ncbi:hypothetical protein KDN24_05615 [Bacillus sp. Bva_UNVM-123]|uniref:hypothetical protein n=1 Tax=Bacillus sp. Bva_UNVM-123 TaxID=2829798 RepID=UPI00391EECEF
MIFNEKGKKTDFNEVFVSEYDFEDGLVVDVRVKAKVKNDLETTLLGIEQLINSIDPKHACREDQELYQQSMDENFIRSR